MKITESKLVKRPDKEVRVVHSMDLATDSCGVLADYLLLCSFQDFSNLQSICQAVISKFSSPASARFYEQNIVDDLMVGPHFPAQSSKTFTIIVDVLLLVCCVM